MESFKAQMVITLAIPDEEYTTMQREAPLESTKYKTYWNMEVMFGRKPTGVVTE